jgi:GNAT superfamily N-acetyltransferase
MQARERARAWRDAGHRAVCDSIQRWEHGTVARAGAYPRYFDFNVVRVEDDPGLAEPELHAFANRALAGLTHRRVDFDLIESADALRGEFEARGWTATRLLWLRHEHPPPESEPELGEAIVESVPYEIAQPLRALWHLDFNEAGDAETYHAQAREVALRRGTEVLAVRKGGEPVAFVQLERDGSGAEITQVYVHPAHRGGGLGTAITRAAIAHAGEVEDLWICADDEERVKELYMRLGFVPVWTSMNFLLQPVPSSGAG